jgi:hypothetical protein
MRELSACLSNMTLNPRARNSSVARSLNVKRGVVVPVARVA